MRDAPELIAAYLDGALDPAQRAKLTAWLRADTEHLRQFTEAVRFEQQLREAVQAGDSDIYITASRHKQPGDFPIKRVTVVKNITRTNGIRVQGWPAEKVVVKDNRHLGAKPGKLIDEAGAELANNTNYEVRSVPPLSLRKDAK